MKYAFYRMSQVGPFETAERAERDLADDAAAIGWMGCEVIGAGERLIGFRGDDEEPFARRAFGETVQVES